MSKVVGAEIPRASAETIQALLFLGLIYIGDDNRLHAYELRK